MVTLGMDLCSFALSKPRAKLHKSIPLVTIFLLIGNPWWILYVPHDQSLRTFLIVPGVDKGPVKDRNFRNGVFSLNYVTLA